MSSRTVADPPKNDPPPKSDPPPRNPKGTPPPSGPGTPRHPRGPRHNSGMGRPVSRFERVLGNALTALAIVAAAAYLALTL